MEKKIKELLEKNTSNVIVKEDIKKKLASGKKLRIKLGVDPTSPDLHLGHAVVLRKIREFQELGHKIVFIIGDFTAMIGDPSGRVSARPPLKKSEVEANMKGYLKQAGVIIDLKKTEILYNSSWLKKLNGEKIFEILGLVSVNQLLEREDFNSRFKAHHSIRMHELLYPIMQAYDSAVIKADIECGGTDQLFNLLMGRQLMERLGMKPQDILTVPLLEGLDGEKKMSKSFGNYIGLTDKPNEMFGKVMSLKDRMTEKYFRLLTSLTQVEIEKIMKLSALEAKERLAFEIVEIYHGPQKAKEARNYFDMTFRKKRLPEVAESFSYRAGESLGGILKKAGYVSSNSDFRRLIRAGAIEANQEIVKDSNWTPEGEIKVRVGKKKFLKIIPK